MKIVAEGQSLDEMLNYSSLLPEGSSGEVRLYLDRQLTQSELDSLQQNLLAQGVTLTAPISIVSRVLIIPYKKMFDPLGAIVNTFKGIWNVVVTGWQIVTFPFRMPWWVWAAGGVGIVYLLTRPKVRQVVTAVALKRASK